MGIGFVLLLWFVLIGMPLTLGLMGVGWVAQRRAGRRWTMLRRAAAILTPCTLLVYGAIAFAAYTIWCGVVRHVDPGIGDSAQVPLRNGYFFCIVDVTAFVLRGGCSGSPPVDRLEQLATVGDHVIGVSRSRGPFTLDTRNDTLRTYPDITSALKQFPSPPVLESVGHFYATRRWGWPDVAAAVLIGIPAVSILGSWYWWLIRTQKGT